MRIVLPLLALLAGCAAPDPATLPPWRIAAVLSAGRADAEVDLPADRGAPDRDIDGAFGGALDLAWHPLALLEFGARAGIRSLEVETVVDRGPNVVPQVIPADVSATLVDAVGYARLYPIPGAAVQPYVEGFGGVGYLHADTTPALLGSNQDSAALLGGAAGVRVPIASEHSLELGLRYSRHETDLVDLELLEAFLGLGVHF